MSMLENVESFYTEYYKSQGSPIPEIQGKFEKVALLINSIKWDLPIKDKLKNGKNKTV